MTIRELIQKLRDVDPDLEVYVGDKSNKESYLAEIVRETQSSNTDESYVEILSG